MKVELDLDKEQINFIVAALEMARGTIYDDPSAHGFDEGVYDPYSEEFDREKLEKDLSEYKEKVYTKVNNQLGKYQ